MIPAKQNALRKQGGNFNTSGPHYNATPNIEPMFVSGFGQFHTNEFDAEKPNKKLTPYTTITLSGIRALVDNPQGVDKAKGQWLITSTPETLQAFFKLNSQTKTARNVALGYSDEQAERTRFLFRRAITLPTDVESNS